MDKFEKYIGSINMPDNIKKTILKDNGELKDEYKQANAIMDSIVMTIDNHILDTFDKAIFKNEVIHYLVDPKSMLDKALASYIKEYKANVLDRLPEDSLKLVENLLPSYLIKLFYSKQYMLFLNAQFEVIRNLPEGLKTKLYLLYDSSITSNHAASQKVNDLLNDFTQKIKQMKEQLTKESQNHLLDEYNDKKISLENMKIIMAEMEKNQ